MPTNVSPCPLLTLGLLLFGVTNPGARAQPALPQGTSPARNSLTAPAPRSRREGALDTTQSPNGTYEGQVCRINYADGTNEYFGYNNAGELAWRRKPDGTIVNIAQRDALHRITQISYPASQGNAAFNVTTAFDEFGRVTSTTDLTGTTSAVYDVLNRITSLTPPAAQKALTYRTPPTSPTSAGPPPSRSPASATTSTRRIRRED